MAEERNINMDTASQGDDGIERGEEPMEQEDTAQPAAPPPAVEKLPPFTKLKARGRKLLRWIPPVKFFGMGEDGYYSIHIEHDCMIKTTRFIEKNIPGYKFHFVPFGPDESIHVLVAPGCPLHSTDKDTTCNDLGCETKPHGTVGCIATLVDPNDKTPSKDDMYVLTAHHVLDKCTIPGGEYVSWTKEDQSDKHRIGNEVPFKISLRCNEDVGIMKDGAVASSQISNDSGIYLQECTEWRDDDTNNDVQSNPNGKKDDSNHDKVQNNILEKFVEQKTMEFEESDMAKEEEEQQYDIACIKMDEQPSNNTSFEKCSCCTNTEKVCELESLLGSKVQKVKHSTEPSNCKIVNADASALITIGGTTAWVSNFAVIDVEAADEVDTEHITNEGDSGSIVCKVHEEKKDWDNSFMIFAGWKNGKCSKSLAFSLNGATKQLIEKEKECDQSFNKTFRFSCSKHVTHMTCIGNVASAPVNGEKATSRGASGI